MKTLKELIDEGITTFVHRRFPDDLCKFHAFVENGKFVVISEVKENLGQLDFEVEPSDSTDFVPKVVPYSFEVQSLALDCFPISYARLKIPNNVREYFEQNIKTYRDVGAVGLKVTITPLYPDQLTKIADPATGDPTAPEQDNDPLGLELEAIVGEEKPKPRNAKKRPSFGDGFFSEE